MARLPHHFEGKLGERFSLCHFSQGVLVVREQLSSKIIVCYRNPKSFLSVRGLGERLSTESFLTIQMGLRSLGKSS